MRAAIVRCSVVLASIAWSALLAAPLDAAGINLHWDDCTPAGAMHRTFACDTDAGQHVQVASFVPPAELQSILAIEATWDACSMGVMWPSWWQFHNPGSCRQSALSVSADFSGWETCADPWQGVPLGGIARYVLDSGSWDAARLQVAYAVPEPVAIEPGTEYYAFRIRIDNEHTVGAGACAGCTVPVCIVLNQITVFESEQTSHHLFNPAMNYSVTWQAMSPVCPFVVPARHATWGQIKSLYR